MSCLLEFLAETSDFLVVLLPGLGVLVFELVDHLLDVVEFVDLRVDCKPSAKPIKMHIMVPTSSLKLVALATEVFEVAGEDIKLLSNDVD